MEFPRSRSPARFTRWAIGRGARKPLARLYGSGVGIACIGGFLPPVEVDWQEKFKLKSEKLIVEEFLKNLWRQGHLDKSSFDI
jgi:hypothetical protein